MEDLILECLDHLAMLSPFCNSMMMKPWVLLICRSPGDKRKSDKNTVKAEGESGTEGAAGIYYAHPLNLSFCQVTTQP